MQIFVVELNGGRINDMTFTKFLTAVTVKMPLIVV